MEDQVIENHTRLYLYDLMNAAQEHGFKGDDRWEFSLVTDTERSKIQRNYHPTIATKIFPEILLQVFHAIKSRLNQALNKEEQTLNTRSILNGDVEYLVAFNPARPRT